MNETPQTSPPRAPYYRVENALCNREVLLACLYLAVHIFAMPLFINWLQGKFPVLDTLRANLLYYGVGVLFTLTALYRGMRLSFDALLDRPLLAMSGLCSAWFLDLVLTLALLGISTYLLPQLAEGVDTDQFYTVTDGVYRKLIYLSILLAPLVEVPLFCGGLFGPLRSKSRLLAYAVTCLVYGVYQVWQYAWSAGDTRYLLFILSYIPSCAALCRGYERTGSLWVPIFFQMVLSATALVLL